LQLLPDASALLQACQQQQKRTNTSSLSEGSSVATGIFSLTPKIESGFIILVIITLPSGFISESDDLNNVLKHVIYKEQKKGKSLLYLR
jgi:hypothetical protein